MLILLFCSLILLKFPIDEDCSLHVFVTDVALRVVLPGFPFGEEFDVLI